MPPRGNSDEFGIPLNITGRYPEEFYSMMGRLVALASTLEHQILTFYQHLVGRDQTAFTELGVGSLIAKSLTDLHRLPPGDAALAREWLLEARAATRRRNDYIHNMWPGAKWREAIRLADPEKAERAEAGHRGDDPRRYAS